MNNIGLYFYLTGCVIALIIGIIEIIKDKPQKGESREYGMIAGMVILSWFTVIIYILNFDKVKERLKKLIHIN